MTDERDERVFYRAAASLRAPGPRDDDALADVLTALARPGAAGNRARRPRISRGAVRFAAGLAAGIAFAAGLGLGIFAGWRMRGESFRLAREDASVRAMPAGQLVDASAVGLRPVQFMLVAPTASRVALVGEFNDWDASATPMARAAGGAWQVALPLASGRHVYAFVVDGSSWVADPQAPLAPERWFGTANSVLLVNGERRQ